MSERTFGWLTVAAAVFGPAAALVLVLAGHASDAVALWPAVLLSIAIAVTGWRMRRDRVGRGLGALLALLMGLAVPVFYGATGHLLSALDAPLRDAALWNLDARLFGWLFPEGQMSLWIDRSAVLGPRTVLGRVLTEVFQLAYVTYYVWGFGLLLLLVRRYQRRFDAEAWTHLRMFLVAWLGTYLLNYVLYVVVPAMGPWYVFGDRYVHALAGFGLTPWIRETIASQQVTPDCFPSGHTALSWITAVCALRFAPRWGRAATIAAVLITLATVGLRYHYFVDVLAAVPLALVGLWWGGFLGGRARTARRVPAAATLRWWVVPALVLVSVGACGGGGGDDAGPAGPGPVPDDAVREEEPNDEPAQALDLGALEGEVVVAGTIDGVGVEHGLAVGGRDLVRFEAPEAGRFVAVLDLPEGADYDLALFTADGRRLATSRADNGAASVGPVERLFVPVGAGTTYLLEVAGYAGVTDATYLLRLAVAPTTSDADVGPTDTTTTRVADLATPRSFHAVATLPDGSVLACGGTRDPSSPSAAMLNALDTSERFDVAAGTWSAGPALAGARFGPSATVLSSGRVLVAGGDLGGTADLIDPYRGLAATRVPLASGMRALHAATLLPDGRVLLTGGTRVNLFPSPTAEHLDTTEVFDPKTRTFARGPDLAHVRTSHADALLLDGRVLVTGGVGRSDSETLDLRAGASSVTAGPALDLVRDDHTATTLADGRVLLLGGQDGSGRSLDTAALLEDPAADAGSAFAPLAARMGSRRADHQVVRLPSGQVLVLGGEDDPGDGSGDAILTTVDVFDPGAETFSPLPALLVGRDDHRVAPLLDGRVLVVGGEDAMSTSIRAAEIYALR